MLRILYRLKHPELYKMLETAESIELMSRTDIVEWQRGRLEEVLRYAVAAVPYYKQRKDAYIQAGKPIDLQNLPVLEKGELRKHGNEFVPDGMRVRTIRTSGSTGEPLVFYRSPMREASGIASMIRARSWFGVDYFDRSALFIEHGDKFGRGVIATLRLALRPLSQRLRNRLFFSAYEMDTNSLDHALRAMLRFKPTYINGYASSLYMLAQHFADSGVDPDELSIRTAFPTSEPLFDWQRKVIESELGVRVGCEYGMVEAGIIAHECPQGTYHTIDDRVIVELLPVDGDGSVREITITTLHYPDIPLIRYRTGDVVRGDLPECSCGIGLGTIPKVLGRSHDFLFGSHGQVVHGQVCTHAVNHGGHVRRFQVIQSKVGELLVIVEPLPEFSTANLTRIKDGLTRVFGGGMMVSVKVVDQIATSRSGKFRWIVSNIAATDRSEWEKPS